MARIEWDKVNDRTFDSGLDRGVLYPPETRGVPWNGLISVDQRSSKPTVQKYYIDGALYYQKESHEDFSGAIRAFTYPEELDYLTGYGFTPDGILIDGQPHQTFGLSYRTLVGDGANPSNGYKIHLVYNVLAVPDTETHSTLGDNPSAETLSWTFDTTPETIPGYRNTAHLVFDSTKIYPGIMESLEDIIYGSYGVDPRLPTISEIFALKNSFDLVRINQNLTTGLNPLDISATPDLVGELDKGLFVRSRPTRLRDLPTDGLSDLEN